MPPDRDRLNCEEHGDAYVTFVCGHLADNPYQEWFSDEPTEDNPWPDSWCGQCNVEFLKYGEWNDTNSKCLDLKILCHECYQWARAQGSNGEENPVSLDPELFPRLKGAVTFTLDNGVELNREAPDTFFLPSEVDRTTLQPGDLVKLIFRLTDGEKTTVERMWVIIKEVRGETYLGVLDNQPYCTESIEPGLPLEFHSDHIIQIERMT